DLGLSEPSVTAHVGHAPRSPGEPLPTKIRTSARCAGFESTADQRLQSRLARCTPHITHLDLPNRWLRRFAALRMALVCCRAPRDLTTIPRKNTRRLAGSSPNST